VRADTIPTPVILTTKSSLMPSPVLIDIADAAAGSSATIAPERGAIITSFKVRGRELLYLDQATFLDSSKNVRGGVPILFPSPGKLADDYWHCDGQSGSMKQHGFARTCAWEVSDVTPQAVTLTLRSTAATLAQYPWSFVATLQVAIFGSRLRLTMQIDNTGASAMPFALGYHPYFLVSDKRNARIDTDATRQFDNVSKAASAFTGFDLTRDELDLHLLDQSASSMSLHLGEGAVIQVNASPEFAHWVIWTVAGKDYVCVEPWTSPGNALNSGERLQRLAPGQSQRSFIEIGFEVPLHSP
jgi:galactose mutarotase-like enzyme